MHQALAVATQDHGSHQAGGGLRRLSVHADSVHLDLALSATAPIGSLIPPIVDILAAHGGYRAGPAAVRYRLSVPGGGALDPSKTLAQIGIRDGADLLLTSSSAESAVPRIDDAAEAVSESVAAVGAAVDPASVPTWSPRRPPCWLAAICAAILIQRSLTTQSHRAGNVAVATTTSL